MRAGFKVSAGFPHFRLAKLAVTAGTGRVGAPRGAGSFPSSSTISQDRGYGWFRGGGEEFEQVPG